MDDLGKGKILMTKRFVLSAAGASAAAIGGAANAEIVTLNFHYDYYAGESGWTIIDSASNVVLSAVAGSVSGIYSSSSFGVWNSSSTGPGGSGYYHNITVDLASGNYLIQLTDTWGDGWEWGNCTGYDAFVYGAYSLSFIAGYSTTGSFTVVPAPGALAILGLAGVAGIKRRRH